MPRSAELADRLDRTRASMRRAGLDALALPGPEDVYYLTGLAHQGYFAFTLLVVPLEGPPLLVARAMEATTVSTLAPGTVHVPYADDASPVTAAVDALRRAAGDGVVGIERHGMFLPAWIYDSLRSATNLVDASGLVEQLRRDRSETEVAHSRAAAVASSRAMAAGLASVRAGVTEHEIVSRVSAELFAAGSEYPGFVPLVRTRGRILLEHEAWSETKVGSPDAVMLELSASVRRYHAPLSRIVYIGQAPPGLDDSARIAGAGLEAVRAALVPGNTGGAVYAAWQQVMDDALGPGRYVRHHCGYLVGIGFPPSWVGSGAVTGLRRDGDLDLTAGMTFHVLSWILGQDLPDYVLSDTVLVTPEGGEILTTAPREPIVVAASSGGQACASPPSAPPRSRSRSARTSSGRTAAAGDW